MNFQKYDLGNLSAGEIIEITLVQNAANVRLMCQHPKISTIYKWNNQVF